MPNAADHVDDEPMRTSATSTPHSTGAAGHTKHCNGCDRALPIDEFRFKNRATGRRQSRCVDCAAATSARHYRNNAEKVKARAAARNTKVRSAHAAVVAAARAAARCTDCGAPHSDEKPVQFTATDGSRRVVDVARGALSADELSDALAAAVPLCHRCVATRRFAASRATETELEGGPTTEMLLSDAIVAALTASPEPLRFAQIMDELVAAGRTDTEKVVRNTLSRVHTAGRVTRVDRGVYRPT